jgi:glycosyltransferase involved in cell wall biosynthesis
MIAVAHLHPTHFAQEVALALREGDADVELLTTLTPNGRDPAARLLKLLGAGNKRRVDASLQKAVRTYPWRELWRMVAGKLGADEVRRDTVFHWALDGFDAWVARQMKPPVRMIYAYETQCLKAFSAARVRGIKTVLDLPSPEHDYVENLLNEEYAKFPGLLTPAKQHFRTLQAERTARRHREFELADVVVANSHFTARTWADAGLDGSKIRVVPLGGPAPDPRGIEGGSRGNGPLRLVWAGTFSVRKGAHYILEAWRRWNPGAAAVLDVYGTVALPTSLLGGLPSNIVLHGPVSRDRVLEAFLRGDLLVFPTLCDGFGLVVPEALSKGLPVLTTKRAGSSDLVEDASSGLVIDSADAGALSDALVWALQQREKLQSMRLGALKTAAANQWSDYAARLRKALGVPVKSL